MSASVETLWYLYLIHELGRLGTHQLVAINKCAYNDVTGGAAD